MTYTFTTFQELVDRVPSDKIALCLKEIGIGLQQAKSTAELVYLTAEFFAKAERKELPPMPDRLIEVPMPMEWIDDGKGEISTTLTGFSDGADLVITNQPKPGAEPALENISGAEKPLQDGAGCE